MNHFTNWVFKNIVIKPIRKKPSFINYFKFQPDCNLFSNRIISLSLITYPFTTKIQPTEVISTEVQGLENQPKLEPKKQRIKIILEEKDLIEKFIKGSGNGGQKINKTNSRVELKHIPTGIVIQCQKTRSQSENRKIARKLLIQSLDEYFNKELSKKSLKAKKINKQKKKQAKRAREKYGVKKDLNKDSNIEEITNFTDKEILIEGEGNEGLIR